MKPVAEFNDVTRQTFEHDILPLGLPAVMRGLVRDWPLVQTAALSDQAGAAYLKRFGGTCQVEVVLGRSEIEGRFHYAPDLRGFNFIRDRAPFDQFLDQLLRQANVAHPIAMAMQSTMIRDILPGFADENRLDLLPADIEPRMWIGGPLKVATHYDAKRNIACTVAGNRRFTLFPPNQVANLYPGPLEATPAGAPVSMVHVSAPDLERYPRFAQALEAAEVANLAPGDALYIPYHWWHHVESLSPLSVLVNYWWSESLPIAQPMDALLHGLLALRTLPGEQRRAWRELFDYWVFETHGNPSDHLPPHARGVLGTPSPTLIAAMRERLRQALAPDES